MAENPGLSRTAKIILALVALGATCIPCIGASAAIAFPAWTQYTRRSRLVEARSNLTLLRTAVESGGTLPPALPFTPDINALGAEGTSWPASADPRWAALGFSPPSPLHYAYAITPDPTLGTVRIEATGDLDGDGFRSSFSQLGHFDAALAGFTWDEVIVLDELE